MGKRILMTGATGFLGSRLLRALVQETSIANITILKRSYSRADRILDLLPIVSSIDIDLHPLEQIFRDSHYDVILHCATDYGRNPRAHAQLIESNVLLPLQLIDLAAGHGAAIFINSDTLLDRQLSSYSLSKSQFREWFCRASERMACINMRLEHFYGPGDDRTKFVSGLIGALLERRSHIDLTAGMQTRDFVYIDDVTDAFLHVLRSVERQSGYLEFEVGGGQPTRLKDFVEMAREVCANTSTDLRFGALTYRPHEAMVVVADTSRLRALGWKNKWTLRRGIEATVAGEKAMLQAVSEQYSCRSLHPS